MSQIVSAAPTGPTRRVSLVRATRPLCPESLLAVPPTVPVTVPLVVPAAVVVPVTLVVAVAVSVRGFLVVAVLALVAAALVTLFPLARRGSRDVGVGEDPRGRRGDGRRRDRGGGNGCRGRCGSRRRCGRWSGCGSGSRRRVVGGQLPVPDVGYSGAPGSGGRLRDDGPRGRRSHGRRDDARELGDRRRRAGGVADGRVRSGSAVRRGRRERRRDDRLERHRRRKVDRRADSRLRAEQAPGQHGKPTCDHDRQCPRRGLRPGNPHVSPRFRRQRLCRIAIGKPHGGLESIWGASSTSWSPGSRFSRSCR